MKIIYHNSSTVSIIENNTKIVCDPWILDVEYYGSWFHYPKYDIDNNIFDCNAIYISHIHGDHLSDKSLRKFEKSNSESSLYLISCFNLLASFTPT